MKKLITFIIFIITTNEALAALPFVTDDAGIANKNQLQIEAFSERWHLPKKGNSNAATLSGNYLGLSYGVGKNLEATVGSLVGYDFTAHSAAFMNPILQLKTIINEPKNQAKPTIAMSFGYVNRNGSGQYYDTANNFYLLGIATSRFFNKKLVIHVNAGPKASFDTGNGRNVYRLQLGIAADMALLRDDLRFIVESFNGAPNSPRDSSGYFHSYQVGFRWLKSDSLAFHILYGTQPTFMGYDAYQNLTFRNSNWVQIGVRKSIENLF